MISALGKIFRESGLGKTAVAATVALPLTLAAFGPASNDAYAGDGQVRYEQMKPEVSEQRVIRLGGSASNGRFALVVFSNNDAVLRAAYEVAQSIEDNTPYDVTFLHAPLDSPISRVMVIANGHTILDSKNGGDIAALKKDIENGFQLGSKQLANVDKPEPAGSG